MEASDLRVALVSGNYNMVRDGPTQALNRLVGHVLELGGAVRVFAPTVENPQVEAVGELISVPSLAIIPGRAEYRVPLGLMGEAKRKFEEFRPNLVHVASPDKASRQAVDWARKNGVPVLGSVHTRFETYPRYYKLGFLEPAVEAWLRAMYRKCDALVAPSEGMVDVLRVLLACGGLRSTDAAESCSPGAPVITIAPCSCIDPYRRTERCATCCVAEQRQHVQQRHDFQPGGRRRPPGRDARPRTGGSGFGSKACVQNFLLTHNSSCANQFGEYEFVKYFCKKICGIKLIFHHDQNSELCMSL